MAWASGTSGTVLRTIDGGQTWQNCAIPPGAEKLDLRGIQGFDADTAIIMSSGTASWIDDHRYNFRWHASEKQPHGYRSAVAYDISTNSWITVGPSGTDISTDDGRNWHAVGPSAEEPANAVLTLKR